MLNESRSEYPRKLVSSRCALHPITLQSIDCDVWNADKLLWMRWKRSSSETRNTSAASTLADSDVESLLKYENINVEPVEPKRYISPSETFS